MIGPAMVNEMAPPRQLNRSATLVSNRKRQRPVIDFNLKIIRIDTVPGRDINIGRAAQAQR
jgi:hypothetical protein